MKNHFLVLFSLVLAFNAKATHITGGEITYEHLGENVYSVDVTIYRDCGPDNVNQTQFDDLITIAVYENGVLFTDFFLTSDFLFGIPNSTQGSDNPCLVVPSSLCVEARTYNTDAFGFPASVELPPSPFGYDLVFQRCCRNNSIINIIEPDASGMTITTHIPSSDLIGIENNSSPTFNNLPPLAFCIGQELNFDHSATDLDGDDLVYELCAPLLGGTPDFPIPFPEAPPFQDITWETGYSSAYPIDSDPILEIDPITGIISGTPNTLGRYTLGICVHEYRNGNLIGSTNREFQYQITACDPVISSAIAPQDNILTCSGLTFEFQNNSINSTYYSWDFGDDSTTEDTSEEFEPTYTYPQEGTYQVTLIVNEGYPCADTTQALFLAEVPEFEVNTPTFTVECNSPFNLINLQGSGTYDEDAELSWSSDPPAAFDTQDEDSTFIGSLPGVYEITFSAINENCISSESIILEVPELPQFVFQPQNALCTGFEYDFTSLEIDADSILWNFGDTTTDQDTSSISNPTYQYPEAGAYTVTYTAYYGDFCPLMQQAEFVISEEFVVSFSDPLPQCLEQNSFSFTPNSNFSDQATCFWEFSGPNTLSSSFQHEVGGVSWNTPGTYTASLYVVDGACSGTYEATVEVLQGPLLAIDLSSTEGCAPLELELNSTSNSDSLQLYWYLNDDIIAEGQSANLSLNDPGTYTISAEFEGGFGCPYVGESMSTIVTVWPLPQANFSISPEIISEQENEIALTSLSLDNVSCEYDLNGEIIQDCNTTYSFSTASNYEVTQIVTNEFGCMDTTSLWVSWETTDLNAPNIFTPDLDGNNNGTYGQGLNEGWFIIGINGIENVHVKIFNRWGGIVYEDLSYSNNTPFKGLNNNGKPLSEGIYYFVINSPVHDEMEGSLTLLRN